MSTLKIERLFPVDPAKVFAFVTQTENLLKWWGPEGMHVPEHNLSFAEPGPWMSVMANNEGGRYKVSGEVLSVDPPNSVELSWAWHDENDERGHESKVRFEVQSDDNGGTRFTLTHSDLADDESVANHNQGWTSSLVKLEQLAS